MSITVNRAKAVRIAASRGATLIEVLVSMLILAGGILGMNALQTSSIKSNQNAYMRQLANTYALDIIERLRANTQAAANDGYDDPAGVVNANCVSATGCTAAQMAGNDVAEWETLVSTNLPLGAGVVCLDSTPNDGTPIAPACDGAGNLYAVKIWWDDDRSGAAARNYVMTFRP